MPLWGASTSDESKPKNLTAEEKSRTFATTRGWEIRRPDGTDEVIVAIRNLSAAEKLAAATISQVFFTANSYSTGATGTVRVVWNERVTPTTTGTLSVTATALDGTSVSTITATRNGNGGPNYVNFNFTVPSVTGTTLTIGAQTITMGINDYGSTTVTSDLTIATADVNAANVDGGSTSVVTTA